MGKIGWFSTDDEGKVIAKTEIREDGTVHRYPYTKADDIKAGHGHDKWDSVDSYLYDDEHPDKTFRDKNDSKSKDRRWKGNGYDLGINELENLSLEELYSLKTAFIHSTVELMLDEMVEEQISYQASKHR